jgi:hypothetical protein
MFLLVYKSLIFGYKMHLFIEVKKLYLLALL